MQIHLQIEILGISFAQLLNIFSNILSEFPFPNFHENLVTKSICKLKIRL